MMAEAVAALQTEFELLHLSPCIGTEVHGIDLGSDLDEGTIQALSDLLVERKVIFFRDQHIDMAQHVAFAARFGALEVHPFTANDQAFPEVIHLINDREHPPYINVWHSDVTWRQEPSLGSILRARLVPEVGGDTLFANMEAAYEGLDQDTRDRIEGLQAVHDNEGFLAGMKAGGATDEEVEAMREKYPPSVHPVVRTHPVSGRKSIYVNRAFTRRIVDMAPTESDALLEKLFLQAWIPDYQCRFRWRPDSFAFWDNRAAQHYAAADYWPERRAMERVTIIGDRPR
jgi:taurine dioxygenase